MLFLCLFNFLHFDLVGWQSQCAFPRDPYGRKNSENGGQQNLPSSWLMFSTTQFEEQKLQILIQPSQIKSLKFTPIEMALVDLNFTA